MRVVPGQSYATKREGGMGNDLIEEKISLRRARGYPALLRNSLERRESFPTAALSKCSIREIDPDRPGIILEGFLLGMHHWFGAHMSLLRKGIFDLPALLS